MSKYKANYWNSDQVTPSVFKENITRNLSTAIQSAFNRNKNVVYNAETNCIDVSFDCDEFELNLGSPNILFDDIFNEEYVADQTYNTSFIYHELLNKILHNCKGELDNLSRGVSSDIIWRIARYVGASDTLSRTNIDTTNDAVWERIHNEW